MKEFGKAFGEAAYKVANKMGGTKSQGKCALAVGDALSMVMGQDMGAINTKIKHVLQNSLFH